MKGILKAHLVFSIYRLIDDIIYIGSSIDSFESAGAGVGQDPISFEPPIINS
jgi:hypothetical protein